MVRPSYHPGPLEQERLRTFFHVSPVQAFVVRADEPGDNRVVLEVDRSTGAPRGICIDRYILKKNNETLQIEPLPCEKKVDHRVEFGMPVPKSFTSWWYSLQASFIPDAKPFHTPRWMAVLTDPETWPENDLRFWRLANPRFDFERRYWASRGAASPAGRKKPPFWRNWAAILSPLEEGLRQMVEKRKGSKAWVKKGKEMGRLFVQIDALPHAENLKRLAEEALPEAEKTKILKEAEGLVFNTYPFLSDKALALLAGAVALWVRLRLLYEAGARFQKMRPKVEPALASLALPADVITRFQKRLTERLLAPETTAAELERMRLFYQVHMWRRQGVAEFSVPLIETTDVAAYTQKIERQFDAEIAFPIIQHLVSQLNLPEPVFDEPTKGRLLARLSFLLQTEGDKKISVEAVSAETVFAWRRINTGLTPPLEKIPALEGMPQTVLEKIVERPQADKRYFLSAPAAFEITDGLKTATDRGIAEALLRAGEGDFLELEPEARLALLMALNRLESAEGEGKTGPPAGAGEFSSAPMEVTSLSVSAAASPESPFYKQWWFWSVAGAVLAAGAGTIYTLSRQKEGDSGQGSGTTTLPDDKPPMGDPGRGTTETLGE